MKYSLALIAISLMFSACTNEPERVVESEWTPEQPKLVAFFLEENDKTPYLKRVITRSLIIHNNKDSYLIF